MTARWRLGSRNPFTVYRVADGAHDVEHGGYFLGSFRREEDARRSVDAVNAQAVHDGDTCQSADSDLESAQGELNEARLWLARRGVEVKTHRSLTWALNGAERAGVVGGPAEPAGSAVGQRGAPTRNVLVEAFDDALFYNGPDGASVFRWVEGRFTPADEPMLAGLAERMADVALAALRDRGADIGGEDATRCPSERSDSRCVMWQGHDGRHQNRGGWQWTDFMVRPMDIAELDDEDDEQPRSWTELADEFKGTAQGAEEHSRKHEQETGRADLYSLGRASGRCEAEARIRFMAGRLGSSADTRATIARLSTALGVSLDPDDPDPVGRLVEAAGKAREVEVVSGAEAATLPRGSRYVACDDSGIPLGGATVLFVGSVEEELSALTDYVVLDRRPAPAPAALAVGEVVESAADLDRRATVGTIVESETGSLYKLDGEVTARDVDLYPAVVVRVGTGGGEPGE